MRRRPTDAERRLWWHLRHHLPVEGPHVRRQVVLAGFIVDFCCLSAKLIIEVDGGGHGHDVQAAHDARRDEALTAHGFRVLRFSNHAIMREIESVLETIASALTDVSTDISTSGTTPTPNPSPQVGGQ